MDFKTEKKGYNKSEVDEYILRLVKNYERTAASQSGMIEELKSKLAESEQKNKAYRDKESLVSKAITSAVAKADEIDRLARLKYTREMQQLKAFHDKWLSYYDKILKKYPLDAELVNAGKFNEEMSRILEKARADSKADHADDRAFEEEKADTREHGKTRLGYTIIDAEDGSGADELEGLPDGDFDPVDRIRAFLTKERPKKARSEEREKAATSERTDDYADRSPSGFSFEEALNPKEDLADIMRDLGLLLD